VTARCEPLKRKKPPRPINPGLLKRYHAALKIASALSFDERYDLVAVVVWPADKRLRGLS
jgi:hypothetical protein